MARDHRCLRLQALARDTSRLRHWNRPRGASRARGVAVLLEWRVPQRFRTPRGAGRGSRKLAYFRAPHCRRWAKHRDRRKWHFSALSGWHRRAQGRPDAPGPGNMSVVYYEVARDPRRRRIALDYFTEFPAIGQGGPRRRALRQLIDSGTRAPRTANSVFG